VYGVLYLGENRQAAAPPKHRQRNQWERKTVQPPPARGLRFLHARHQSEAQQAAAATRPAAEWPWARARTEGSVRDVTVSRKSGRGFFVRDYQYD
jgi:hypothetical protein